MSLITEYPDHAGKIKFIFAAFFAAAYFAVDNLGTASYSWQPVLDLNVWANSFLATAMFYCTFDALADLFLRKHKDAKPFFSILSFVLSTILSSSRSFSLSAEIPLQKKAGIYFLFFFDFLCFLALELLGYNFSYLDHAKEIDQAQKNYLREFNCLGEEQLDAFIFEYSRLVSNPETFALFLPNASYDFYVQMLKDAVREKERRTHIHKTSEFKGS
jgi:hypothetical protein